MLIFQLHLVAVVGLEHHFVGHAAVDKRVYHLALVFCHPFLVSQVYAENLGNEPLHDQEAPNLVQLPNFLHANVSLAFHQVERVFKHEPRFVNLAVTRPLLQYCAFLPEPFKLSDLFEEHVASQTLEHCLIFIQAPLLVVVHVFIQSADLVEHFTKLLFQHSQGVFYKAVLFGIGRFLRHLIAVVAKLTVFSSIYKSLRFLLAPTTYFRRTCIVGLTDRLVVRTRHNKLDVLEITVHHILEDAQPYYAIVTLRLLQ